ncbi:hypothetical protein NQ317_006480 [Molorchus minor]|uniref:Uncharacterized protein n=1 Tax=Molorchus minor TaxID=1323400 RepID=A0ABQ9J639_9CUCU|nr:hypothetical protein NQ317_006480 [Molorchus minor]
MWKAFEDMFQNHLRNRLLTNARPIMFVPNMGKSCLLLNHPWGCKHHRHLVADHLVKTDYGRKLNSKKKK